MELNRKEIEIFIPDNEEQDQALSRTTHLAIGAHQDDVEIMAYHGISSCFQQQDQWFSAIIVTNGSGSARDNIYKDYTDEQMMKVRRVEQIKASVLGEYASLVLLNHPSREVKHPNDETSVQELVSLIKEMKPEIIYTHNLADKHDTHVGVVTKVIKALRLLEPAFQPKKVYGCEVWRDLDWMVDEEKIMFDVSKHPNLAASLVEIFDSQIIGGKRYDRATLGRRLANATFSSSHSVDEVDALTYAMDLTPLMKDSSLDMTQFVFKHIDGFKNEVQKRIEKVSK
jgi:LmbE family N-acetylglucosaminyl deacetylase